MRNFYSLILSFILLLLLVACNETKTVETERTIREVVPAAINIDDYPAAKAFLATEIEACGAGVVEGTKGENHCTHTIKVDADFVQSLDHRKGLILDESIFQKDGATWFEPSVTRDVPETFNVLDLQKEKTVPGNQGNCGSCWAYSTHQGWEIVLAILTGKMTDLSAQTVLSCSDIDAQNWGCQGGTMEAVAFVKRGLPLEKEFPYKASKVSCKFTKAQLGTGWTPKPIDTPWVGTSRSHSRYWKAMGVLFADGDKVAKVKAAMVQMKSPAVVTVAAFSVSGNGVYSSCSEINSGGDHMVNISAFDKDTASVYNSWGSSFGVNGIGKIKWECGAGKLNRGLGVEARVISYAPSCTLPEAYAGNAHQTILKGSSVKLGKKQLAGVTCSWAPVTGLQDPTSCETFSTPEKSTEYHLTAKNDCGSVSAMAFVEVFGPTRDFSPTILTPYGEIPSGR